MVGKFIYSLYEWYMMRHLDPEKMPKHIAIIMDGNRRYSKIQGNIDVVKGHEMGVDTLEKVLDWVIDLGIEIVTVYAFSTENWKRAEDEVNALMILFQNYIDKYSKIANSENVRVQFLGDLTAFSEKMQKGIQKCIDRTKGTCIKRAQRLGDNIRTSFHLYLMSRAGRKSCFITLVKENRMFFACIYSRPIDQIL